jgi:hypothetical protein
VADEQHAESLFHLALQSVVEEEEKLVHTPSVPCAQPALDAPGSLQHKLEAARAKRRRRCSSPKALE